MQACHGFITINWRNQGIFIMIFEIIKEALIKADKLNLSIKELPEDSKEIYKACGKRTFCSPLDTHYIMDMEGDILTIGSKKVLNVFLLNDTA